MIKNTMQFNGSILLASAFLAVQPGLAGVDHQQINSLTEITYVSQDAWQPEGFDNGTSVPATWLPSPDITVDGLDDEDAWSLAKEIAAPLQFGTVKQAWLKALYTNDEVFIRVRWADSTEDRSHHPWVWDADSESFTEGSQIEDSVMLSFEAGCEWTPSLLGGYMYDFDAWHWLAARSDPLGQAVDLYGNVQDRDTKLPNFVPYDSRVIQKDWILKFTENQNPDLHADWNELDRVYMMQPVTKNLWVQAVPDGGRQAPNFVKKLPAPSSAPVDNSKAFPQFSPLKLTGDAGEVAAKGQWKDGYWTVEFRRARETPVRHIFDTVFNRTIQFSVHVFDQVDTLDKVSESQRLFLRFLKPEQSPLSNPAPELAGQ